MTTEMAGTARTLRRDGLARVHAIALGLGPSAAFDAPAAALGPSAFPPVGAAVRASPVRPFRPGPRGAALAGTESGNLYLRV
jgi:hypothetical protein